MFKKNPENLATEDVFFFILDLELDKLFKDISSVVKG